MSKILVVDDEAANRLLVAAVLQPHGHEVFEAADGTEGLQLAHDLVPDLIVVDLFMPGMSGTELVKALRADPGTRDTRIALYSATRPDAALRDFMHVARVEHVIPKPSEPEELVRIVNDALSS
ncbi:MAG TPA: response regulator [Candidatus Rubrimentiphilum sp.]|nr:response regulator [Candidatus Rubrimentiphilum sp.]